MTDSSSRPLLIALLAFGLLMSLAIGFVLLRPSTDTAGRTSVETRATGRCASCHYEKSPQMVQMHSQSIHALKGVSCIDCHVNQTDQKAWEHYEFVITETVTSKNCARCHEGQYQEFLTSAHSLPAWAAVNGKDGMSESILSQISARHPDLLQRKPSEIIDQLPVSAVRSGCEECHKIGRPNPDGSVGNCIDCHTAHDSSKATAGQPEACGRCHSGADHQQLEIYLSSKHGVLHSQLRRTNDARKIQASDQNSNIAPSCVTCHMGKVGEQKSNHDISQRIAHNTNGGGGNAHPSALKARQEMQQVCLRCHSSSFVQSKFRRAEQVEMTVQQLMAGIGDEYARLQSAGIRQDNEEWNVMDYEYFDAWHQHARSAKHGAFMGSPGHVVWQGIYQLQKIHAKFRASAGPSKAKSAEP